MMGVNWNNALEQAMRMISWSFVWSWTGGLRGALFDFKGGDRLRSAVSVLGLPGRRISSGISCRDIHRRTTT